MRAWRVHELGEPAEVLRLDDVPAPEPRAGLVAVRVLAAGLNFPDVLLCRGQYQVRPPLPFTPGVECYGEVVAVGAGVRRHAVGDRVIGMPALPGGALAEVVLAAEEAVRPAVPELSAAQNAGLMLAYQTAYVALHRRGRLRAGETLLVHGGAGGVGSAAIQLGVAAGATVLATAGGPEKAELCRRLGAAHAVDYSSGADVVGSVRELTGGRGVDVVLDTVGGDVFDASLRLLAWEGRLLVVGFTSGRIGIVPANRLLLRGIEVIGVYWGEYLSRDPAVVDEAHAALAALAAAGQVAPYVSAEVPFAEAAAAVQRLADRRGTGKTVVTVEKSG